MTNFEHPLQSETWEEFRKAWGNEVVRLNGWLLTLHKLPFVGKKIAMFEKGPTPTPAMLKTLRGFAEKENIIMIRMEPNVQKDSKLISLLRKNGAVPGKTIFTPTTFWVDLSKSEEELMASFHPKTRYNIHLAQRKGVIVEEDSSDSAFEKYLSLMAETVSRQGFYAHSAYYHKLMWEYMHTRLVKQGQKPIAHLLVAKYQGKIIASWILFAYDGVLYYPYGASSSNSNHYRLMPSALLMWEAIKFGKKLGLKTFDLWGREPGKGFTRFKEGYNPKVLEFLGTWDLVINPFLYWPYRIAESIRWILLRIVAKLGLSMNKF